MSPEPILRLEGVSKYFGDFTALDNINLEIDEGEFLTIVGPSGSGKTTLIRILSASKIFPKEKSGFGTKESKRCRQI